MRLFLHQLRFEQLVFWRSREAAFFIFGFPLLLFVLLGTRAWSDRAAPSRSHRAGWDRDACTTACG